MAKEAADDSPDAAELCARAREQLGSSGSFRVRVLLDMVLIELARLSAEALESPASDRPDDG